MRDENLLRKRQTFAAPQMALSDSTEGGASGQRVSPCSTHAMPGLHDTAVFD
jgi:hypothetical protein